MAYRNNYSRGKQSFKKYSVDEKIVYHKKRLSDLSKKKRDYSYEWLRGFFNQHADKEYDATLQNVAKMHGSVKGMKARLGSHLSANEIEALRAKHKKKV